MGGKARAHLSDGAGDTSRWEMCWQTRSFGERQGPVILKAVKLLSVFLIYRNQGRELVIPWLSVDTDDCIVDHSTQSFSVNFH